MTYTPEVELAAPWRRLTVLDGTILDLLDLVVHEFIRAKRHILRRPAG